MPRDYKSRANAHARQSTPGWIPFAAGFVLGLFVAGLAWIKLSPPGAGGAPQASAPSVPRAARVDQAQEEKAPRPRFDFYTLLPAQEVVVPEEEMRERLLASYRIVRSGLSKKVQAALEPAPGA